MQIRQAIGANTQLSGFIRNLSQASGATESLLGNEFHVVSNKVKVSKTEGEVKVDEKEEKGVDKIVLGEIKKYLE